MSRLSLYPVSVPLGSHSVTLVETRLATTEGAITSEQNENKIAKLEIAALKRAFGNLSQTNQGKNISSTLYVVLNLAL